jgi:tetratricopeptide (TPR) repeat protein
VGGELVLTTSQAGTNFWIGNGPQATGIYVPLRPERSDTSFERIDAVELAEAGAGRKLGAQQVSHWWLQATLDHIRSDPARWLGLLLRKARLLVNWYEVPDAEDLYFFERSSRVLRGLGAVFHFGVLFPLAAAGLVLTRARRRELAALHLALATLACGPIAFYLMARYRYPLVPGLALLAGAGLTEALERARARRWRELAAAGLALAAFTALSNATIYARDFQHPQSHHNTAVALTQQGQWARAVREYQAAVRLQPGMHESWTALGEALAKLGRDEEAVAAWQQAGRIRPDDWRSAWRIGRLRQQRGDLERALPALRRATRTPGAGAEAWKSLALASQGSGRWREASDSWRRALALAPDDLEARLQLAFLLATCPDPAWRDGAEAMALAEEAAAQTAADDTRALDALAAAQAENGRFDDALETVRRARAAAERHGEAAGVQALRERERAYAQGRPWRP